MPFTNDHDTPATSILTHDLDYYQFEWFRLLVVQILTCATAAIAWSLSYGGIPGSILLSLMYGGIFATIGSFYLLTLTSVLEHHHRETTRKVLRDWLRIPERWHGKLYRCFGWTWIGFSIFIIPLQIPYTIILVL